MATADYLQQFQKRLADEGKLVEAGWVGLRLAAGLENAPADQLREMRLAFLGGAQHLFSSIMSILEPGDEPTDRDMKRMELIAAEMEGAEKELVASYSASKPPRATEPEKPANSSTAQTLGDAPVQAQYREQMKSMAQYVDQFFNGPEGRKTTGFVLLVFPFDDHAGRCNYMSNADRKDVIVLLREQLARFDGSPDVTGRA